jgi:hypothetical protein
MGWNATPAIFGIQAWRAPDGRQNLVLFRFPLHLDTRQAIENSEDYNHWETASHKTIRICGDQPAILFSGRGESSRFGHRRDQQVEMVMTSYNVTYMAMYARDLSVHPNADAERAIRSLCLRR